jgi:hypothetical protein
MPIDEDYLEHRLDCLSLTNRDDSPQNKFTVVTHFSDWGADTFFEAMEVLRIILSSLSEGEAFRCKIWELIENRSNLVYQTEELVRGQQSTGTLQ